MWAGSHSSPSSRENAGLFLRDGFLLGGSKLASTACLELVIRSPISRATLRFVGYTRQTLLAAKPYVNWAASMDVSLETGMPWVMCQ
ncbi:Beta-galactosidase 6 [Platanthera zijinensis]|uniref:Beta-galactosidase 6 n=1 Tax=Platanthera zijinensis TaxID=2320716 RepID=A0AAP0BQY3_9ASPA